MSSCRTVFLEIIRRPSVPSASFQPASQQASCVDRGFDFSIASFPLLCLNSDGDRLCPSIAEPTASVPPFALALPRSRTLQTRSGALSRSSTTSLVQETPFLPARHSFPFLLDLLALTLKSRITRYQEKLFTAWKDWCQ